MKPTEEEPSCLTVLTLGYKAKCTEPGCHNLARVILRRQGDRSGRPLSNLERCHGHARAELERATKAGLTIYDQRKQRRRRMGGLTPQP